MDIGALCYVLEALKTERRTQLKKGSVLQQEATLASDPGTTQSGRSAIEGDSNRSSRSAGNARTTSTAMSEDEGEDDDDDAREARLSRARAAASAAQSVEPALEPSGRFKQSGLYISHAR